MYMLGANDAKQNLPLKRRGLSQTSAEHWAACESTTLPTEWGYQSVTCDPVSICKL